MKKVPIVFIITSILLAGCGGGDSSPSGNAGTSSPASEPLFSLEEATIPTGFNWNMQNSETVTLKHVSNFSQVDSVAINIAGTYYVEIYSIDENDNISASPFLKTMTESNGETKVLLTLLSSWKGITVKTQLTDSVCTNVLYKENISTTISIGCDVVLESESQ